MSFPIIDHTKYRSFQSQDGSLHIVKTDDDQSASILNPVLYPPTTDLGLINVAKHNGDEKRKEEGQSQQLTRKQSYTYGELSWAVEKKMIASFVSSKLGSSRSNDNSNSNNDRKKVGYVYSAATNEVNDMLSLMMIFPKTFEVGVTNSTNGVASSSSSSVGGSSVDNGSSSSVVLKSTFPYPSKKKMKQQKDQQKRKKEKSGSNIGSAEDGNAKNQSGQDFAKVKCEGDSLDIKKEHNKEAPQDARPDIPSSLVVSSSCTTSNKKQAAVAEVLSESPLPPKPVPTFVTNCLKFLLPPPYGENTALLSFQPEDNVEEEKKNGGGNEKRPTKPDGVVNNDGVVSSSTFDVTSLTLDVNIKEHLDKYMLYHAYGNLTMVRVTTEMAQNYVLWRQRNLSLTALLKSAKSMEVELEASLMKFELLNVLEEVPTTFSYQHYQKELIERLKNPNRKAGIILEDDSDDEEMESSKQNAESKETKQFFLPGRCFGGLFDHLGETELCMLIAMNGNEILSKAEACQQWETAQKESSLARSKARRGKLSSNDEQAQRKKSNSTNGTATLTLLFPPHVVPCRTNKSSFLKILKVNDDIFDSHRSAGKNSTINSIAQSTSKTKADGVVSTAVAHAAATKKKNAAKIKKKIGNNPSVSCLKERSNNIKSTTSDATSSTSTVSSAKQRDKKRMADTNTSSSVGDNETIVPPIKKKKKKISDVLLEDSNDTETEKAAESNTNIVSSSKKKASKIFLEDDDDDDKNGIKKDIPAIKKKKMPKILLDRDDDCDRRKNISNSATGGKESISLSKKKKVSKLLEEDDEEEAEEARNGSIPKKKKKNVGDHNSVSIMKKKRNIDDGSDLVDSSDDDNGTKKIKSKRLLSIPKKKGLPAEKNDNSVSTTVVPKKRKIELSDTNRKPSAEAKSSTTVLSTSDNVYDSYMRFAKRTEDVRRLDYIGIHGKIMEGSMWIQHKQLFGEDCDDNCQCLSQIRQLCSNVVKDFESKKGKQKSAKKDQHYTTTGFAKYFCHRFYNHVREEFPSDKPSEVLEKICQMWSKHEKAAKSSVCSALCTCDSKWDSYFLPKVLKPQLGEAAAVAAKEAKNKQRKATAVPAVAPVVAGSGVTNSAISHHPKHQPFYVDYDPTNEVLPFYVVTWCSTTKNIGNSQCKVLFINPFIPSPPRDPRVMNGSIITDSQLFLRDDSSTNNNTRSKGKCSVSSKRSLRTHELLKRGYEYAKKKSFILRLYFDNSHIKSEQHHNIHQTANNNHHWTPNGWAGKTYENGWAGGNPVLHNMHHHSRQPVQFPHQHQQQHQQQQQPPPLRQPQALGTRNDRQRHFGASAAMSSQQSQIQSNIVHHTPSLTWTTTTTPTASPAEIANNDGTTPVPPTPLTAAEELEDLQRQYGADNVLQMKGELPKSKDRSLPSKSILRPSKYSSNAGNSDSVAKASPGDDDNKDAAAAAIVVRTKKLRGKGRKIKFSTYLKNTKYFQRDPALPPIQEELDWGEEESIAENEDHGTSEDTSTSTGFSANAKPSSFATTSFSPSNHELLFNAPLAQLLSGLENGTFDASVPDSKGKYARDYLDQEIKALKAKTTSSASHASSATIKRLKEVKLRRNLLSLYLRSESILRSSMLKHEWKCFELVFQSVSNLHVSARASKDGNPDTIFCEASMPSRPKYATTPVQLKNGGGTMEWVNSDNENKHHAFVFVCDDTELCKENFLQIGIFKGSPILGHNQRTMLGKVSADLSDISNKNVDFVPGMTSQHTNDIHISDFLSQEGKVKFQVTRCATLDEHSVKQREDHLKKDLGHAIQELKLFVADVKAAELDNIIESSVKTMTFTKCYGMNLLHAAVYLEDISAVQALLSIKFDPTKASQNGTAMQLSEQLSSASSKQKEILTLLKVWV